MIRKLREVVDDETENMKQVTKRSKIANPQVSHGKYVFESDKENGLQISEIEKNAKRIWFQRDKQEPFRALQIPHSSTFNFPTEKQPLKPIPKLLTAVNHSSFSSMSSTGTERFVGNDCKKGYFSEETSSSDFSTTTPIFVSPISSQEKEADEPVTTKESITQLSDSMHQFEELTQIELINYYIDHLNCEQDCKHQSDESIAIVTFDGNHDSQEIYKRCFLKLLYVIGQQRHKTKYFIPDTESTIIEAKMEFKQLSLLTKFMKKITELNNEELSQRYVELIRVYGWDSFKEMLLNIIFVEKKKNSIKVI